MTTKVQKWGNSYAIRIPKQMVKDFNLAEGSIVDFIKEKKSMVIRPKKADKQIYSWKEILKDMKPDRIHRDFDWGKPVGNEIW